MQTLEWSVQSKYNSFNSWKGLTYYENYRLIVDWMNGADYLPPPIEVNLDPVAECNLDCYFCITQRYLKHNREEVAIRKLPTDYMLRLVDFLHEWGVKGLCISGGGEPTIHEDLPKVLFRSKMDVAVVTNASLIGNRLANQLMKCRWVALSVDASNWDTYKEVKGRDVFSEVVTNVARLADMRSMAGSNVDLCFKFLVLPENQYEIYEACKLAKELGVQDFHARPVDFERPDIVGNRPLPLDMVEIRKQFEQCHELEDGDFRVYTVTHKYDSEFHVKHDFTECLATPLVLPILSDGNAYLCVDKKMEAKYKLGSCYPEPESILDWWGSDSHRELVKSVNIDSCSRCTWSQYNAQISECVMEDKLCRSFP